MLKENGEHIISLGAGVQSSTMALMAERGELLPKPSVAIFADTQAEPQEVYTWLDYLESQLSFPVVRVTKGDLRKMSQRILTKRKDGVRYWKTVIPTFMRNDDGSKGIVFRACTSDYKINPIRKYLRETYGKKNLIINWMGISTDEAHRMKDSNVKWISNYYPLIEQGMSRSDCLQWMERKGYQEPPRSACYFCPYHSDKEWIRLKTEQPEEFRKAVQFEKELQDTQRNQEQIRTVPFLHASLKPLDEVNFKHQDQPSLFGNDCEGMCGV